MTGQPAMRAAYGAAAEAWARGPAVLYGRLAELILAASPIPLADGLVLDVGAGTGVVSEALRRAGARSIGLDVAVEMLRWQWERRPPGVAADARRLPFRDGTFDAVTAACCLSHFEHPDRALAEAARVVRQGGVVLASAFGETLPHPVKDAVDAEVRRSGYVQPSWYERLKDDTEPLVATPHGLYRCARAAGLRDVTVADRTIETPLRTAEALVDWRLGMAQYADFFAGLAPHDRTAIRASVVKRVEPPSPLTVRLLVLSARVA